MNAIDICCGVGGFSQGITNSGIKIEASIDNNDVACEAYQKNFPDTNVFCDDIETFDFRQFQGIEICLGSPPCTGFSIQGWNDMKDPRNRLIFSFARAVLEIRPRYVIMENVPGIIRPQYSGLLRQYFNQLQEYDFAPLQVLNAAHFGVSQNRRRVFFLGTKKGEKPIQYPVSTNRIFNVSDAISDLPDQGKEEVTALYKCSYNDYSQKLRVPTGMTISNCKLRKHSPSVIERFQGIKQGGYDPIGRYYRLDWNKPANTIKAGTGRSGGRYSPLFPIHPEEDRVISNREAARLCSFSDSFYFSPGYLGGQQIGNSVPPRLAEAIGYAALGEQGAWDIAA